MVSFLPNSVDKHLCWSPEFLKGFECVANIYKSRDVRVFTGKLEEWVTLGPEYQVAPKGWCWVVSPPSDVLCFSNHHGKHPIYFFADHFTPFYLSDTQGSLDLCSVIQKIQCKKYQPTKQQKNKYNDADFSDFLKRTKLTMNFHVHFPW